MAAALRREVEEAELLEGEAGEEQMRHAARQAEAEAGARKRQAD